MLNRSDSQQQTGRRPARSPVAVLIQQYQETAVFITKLAIAAIAVASTTVGVSNMLPEEAPPPTRQQLEQQKLMNHPPAVDIGQLARAFHA